jgi:hypothetical protein
MKTFSDWLLSYKRKNRIGDLAADVRSKPPSSEWDYVRLKTHMRGCGASSEAMSALDAAKRAYYRYASARC